MNSSIAGLAVHKLSEYIRARRAGQPLARGREAFRHRIHTALRYWHAELIAAAFAVLIVPLVGLAFFL